MICYKKRSMMLLVASVLLALIILASAFMDVQRYVEYLQERARRRWIPIKWQNGGWRYRQAVTLTEVAGIDRINEPVDIHLVFLPNHCLDPRREIRVVTDDGYEIPSATYNETYSQGYARSCNIVFLANVSALSNRTYYIYFGNPNAKAPSYETQLIFEPGYYFVAPDCDRVIDTGIIVVGLCRGQSDLYRAGIRLLSHKVDWYNVAHPNYAIDNLYVLGNWNSWGAVFNFSIVRESNVTCIYKLSGTNGFTFAEVYFYFFYNSPTWWVRFTWGGYAIGRTETCVFTPDAAFEWVQDDTMSTPVKGPDIDIRNEANYGVAIRNVRGVNYTLASVAYTRKWQFIWYTLYLGYDDVPYLPSLENFLVEDDALFIHSYEPGDINVAKRLFNALSIFTTIYEEEAQLELALLLPTPSYTSFHQAFMVKAIQTSSKNNVHVNRELLTI